MSLTDEVILLIWKIFSKNTSFFVRGKINNVEFFKNKYREINHIRPGTALCNESPFKLPDPKGDVAIHMIGSGLTGLSKVTLWHGLNWKYEIFKLTEDDVYLKIIFDEEEKKFVLLSQPRGTCRIPCCKGSIKCHFNHPYGFNVPKEEND